MRASDFQMAMHEAAERRAAAEERRHQEEMKEIQKQSAAYQRDANRIASAMFMATVAIILATLVVGGLQVWATLRAAAR